MYLFLPFRDRIHLPVRRKRRKAGRISFKMLLRLQPGTDSAGHFSPTPPIREVILCTTQMIYLNRFALFSQNYSEKNDDVK